jgi:GH15 family glucan-1,4-alpha-glucosidase
MTDLYKHSIEIIRENQSPSGAYVASPNFVPYNYCWYRDGAYIAYAMDLVGEHVSASRFHAWASEVVNKQEPVIRVAVEKVAAGKALSEEEVLHTRYTVEGGFGGEQWPNFQLDGFGTWLWGLAQHLHLSGSKISEVQRRAVQLLSEYLVALWKVPCFDCWEEFPDRVHPHTLAAIFGGLQAVERYLGIDYGVIRSEIREFIMEHNLEDGIFVKFSGISGVDASLIGLVHPYNVFALDDSRIRATIDHIDSTLRVQGGGVHRYSDDTYYGGGEWVLLAGWLGWYYAKVGEQAKALELLRWIEAQADANGDLPEQVPNKLNDKSFYEIWRGRWGDIAKPLLWSHANYLVLCESLNLRR